MKWELKREYDLSGKRFGRLTAVQVVGSYRGGNRIWECKCDCGKVIARRGGYLQSGDTRSCGCLFKETITKHGMCGTRFYGIWQDMRARCNRKTHKHFRYWGGRGITICERWGTFLAFKEDMYASYLEHAAVHGEKNTTIDRIDNDGNYAPENCRWATQAVQCMNKRKKGTA